MSRLALRAGALAAALLSASAAPDAAAADAARPGQGLEPWKKDFLSYAEMYAKGVDQEKAQAKDEGAECLQSALKCKTVEHLEAWKANLLSQLAATLPVSEAVHAQARKDVEGEFRARLAQLQTDAKGKAGEVAKTAARAGKIVAHTAQDCRDEAELQFWKARQLVKIAERVPRDLQAQGKQLLEQEFLRRSAELKAQRDSPTPRDTVHLLYEETPRKVPKCLLNAMACETDIELRAWRATNLAWMRDHLSKDELPAAAAALESDFAKRSAELAKGKAPGAVALVATAENDAPKETEASRRLATPLVVLCGLALPALLALLGGVATAGQRRGAGAGGCQDALPAGAYAMWEEQDDAGFGAA